MSANGRHNKWLRLFLDFLLFWMFSFLQVSQHNFILDYLILDFFPNIF